MNEDLVIGLDLETAKPFPAGEDWREHRPLGIACAVTSGSSDERSWHGQNAVGDGADRMTQAEAGALVDYLQDAQAAGHRIITWNGLGFDLQVLAEESRREDDCRQIALEHVDMMFHIFCIKGFPLSLAAAAQGMRVGAKTEGMSGEDAPEAWRSGDRQLVINYCSQDARLTRSLAAACEEDGELRWIARSGRGNRMGLRDGWKKVAVARQIPKPYNEWMENPISRSEYDGWLDRERRA